MYRVSGVSGDVKIFTQIFREVAVEANTSDQRRLNAGPKHCIMPVIGDLWWRFCNPCALNQSHRAYSEVRKYYFNPIIFNTEICL